MSYQDQDRMLAFAGIYQAAALVHQLSTQGKSDTDALTATLNSLFVENPETTEAVFGGFAGLTLGMRTLKTQMNGSAPNEQRNMQLTQYVIGMIALENKLSKQPELVDRLLKKLSVPESQRKHFGLLHDNTLAGIALIYTDVVSQLHPKIMVRGSHGYLSQPAIANRIRAVLLAGIRSAFLWKQVGGSRWQLLFKRGSYLRAADHCLTSIRAEDRDNHQLTE
jgi:high frequency lysogenization protein